MIHMLVALFFYASLVNDVRALIANNNLAAADRETRAAAARSATPEVAAAFSWLARGAFDARNYDRADSYAAETRKLCDKLMFGRNLDAEPELPLALGASIEVHAQVLAARGARAEAVSWLSEQAKQFANTSIVERLRKNINMLSMEGKPAPAIDVRDSMEGKARTLAELRSHPVLLYFWAHWCGDCRVDAPALAAVMQKWGPRGLITIAPTRLYGYANGAEASPPQERAFIDLVWQHIFSSWSGVGVPVSASNFQTYGASTVPTVVLIDGAGIVRYYHPGSVTEAEISARLQAIFGK
jgi:thiol-disulfide isomerase/thioredoxin